jgi:hypothetical protein
LLCIAGTDVDGGLEYLPASLGENIAREKDISERERSLIDCRPKRPDAKVAQIQEELRPFNYDVLA